MLRLFTATALLALTLTAAQADPLTTASVTVDYGDLNLGRPSDAQVLADRLTAAAQTVCLNTATPQAEMPSCMSYAINSAVSTIEDGLDANVRVHLETTSTRPANVNP